MNARRWTWEELLEEALASSEAEDEDRPDGARRPTDWVVDCMMGCYNFTDLREEEE